jgi:nicotinamide-nucleotide amidase
MKSAYRSVRHFQDFLRRNRLTFACAESCTGGLLSREMTARAGSSEVFWGGAVTYADEAKTALLAVPAELIGREGAVSGAVALAMVDGLVAASGVPLAVAVTGIAGPGGGSPEKPVGTVWFGLSASRGATKTAAVRFRFRGGRGAVQAQAARWARRLAAVWWESDMDLDSLRPLTDNEENLFEPAPQRPLSPTPPLKPFPLKP